MELSEEEKKRFQITVEYSELCDNMRHYGNQRFAALTFFLTSNAVLCKFYFDDLHKTLLPVAGLLFTFVFWRVEDRAVDFWIHYKERAKAIESMADFQQYSARLRSPKLRINATWASNALYIGFFIFWLLSLMCDGLI